MARRKAKGTGTFIVRTFYRQHSSWQGSVTCVEGGWTKNFKSALELLKFIDEALAPDDKSMLMGDSIKGWSIE